MEDMEARATPPGDRYVSPEHALRTLSECALSEGKAVRNGATARRYERWEDRCRAGSRRSNGPDVVRRGGGRETLSYYRTEGGDSISLVPLVVCADASPKLELQCLDGARCHASGVTGPLLAQVIEALRRPR